jgi:hypothetical protein
MVTRPKSLRSGLIARPGHWVKKIYSYYKEKKEREDRIFIEGITNL